MRTKNGFTNDTDFVHSDFITRNPIISIPYLILMSVSTLSGCIGNTLVVGSVISHKVRELTFSYFSYILNQILLHLYIEIFINKVGKNGRKFRKIIKLNAVKI